ncbi:MAG: TetR/AcrR family transcriptional regulator [Actinomycetota bacterium]|nr:TetR/AcrR family transcriptional regulator [Actinomycetota bacterium]
MEPSPSDAAPDPPWWDPPRRTEPRSVLTREAIVTAALRVLDDVGLEGFSMRRVGEGLGTGASTLYWHVAGKEQLIHLVLDRVMGEIELPEPDPSRWEDQIREFAHTGRAVFRRHPGVALASLGRLPLGPNLVQIMEWFLAVLRGAGISAQTASWFADVLALVGAAQAVEEYVASTGEDPASTAMGDYLARLPPDRFPHLSAVAPAMAAGSADDRSEFALELLLRGLASFVEE